MAGVWDDPTPEEALDRLREQVARLEARWARALHALAVAPKVPRWPRTEYSKWFWGIRELAIRGQPDRLADAMHQVGRPVRLEEVYGCCERPPMPQLGQTMMTSAVTHVPRPECPTYAEPSSLRHGRYVCRRLGPAWAWRCRPPRPTRAAAHPDRLGAPQPVIAMQFPHFGGAVVGRLERSTIQRIDSDLKPTRCWTLLPGQGWGHTHLVLGAAIQVLTLSHGKPAAVSNWTTSSTLTTRQECAGTPCLSLRKTEHNMPPNLDFAQL
jgi:hypothetical protein